MPVTATQVWRCLIVDSDVMRWGGHGHYMLTDVQQVLRTSTWLAERLETKWGYYYLPGREYIVRERLVRHSIAQDKWKITRRAIKYLALVPFVKGLAGSGSLAMSNTSASSDLDILVIAQQNRIWTTRLGLLVVSQLLGRRRKYWNRQAPDKLCLNHYISFGKLGLPKEIQNIYTAVLYALLVPVYEPGVIRAFQAKNESWMRTHVMMGVTSRLFHLNTVRLGAGARWIKRFLEGILLEPAGDAVERLAERIQRYSAQRHMTHRSGRIVLSENELAFHPDTKVPAILQAFHQDPAQQKLL